MLETNYINRELYGLSIGWYENGQKSTEENYKNGEMDGLTTYWYKNSQKRLKRNWKNGKSDGETKWNKNGKITSQKTFVDGIERK